MKKTALAAILLVASSMPGLCAGYDDLNAAISYFNQKKYDDAITWFTKALDDGDLIADQKHIAYLDRGVAYALKGDAKNTLADYSSAIAAQPQDLLAYLQRAAAYIALEDFNRAYADYGALMRLRPYDYDIRMTFGRMSWQAGQFDRAALAFQGFANIKTEAWLWLQLANVRLGKPVGDFNPVDDIDNVPGGAYSRPSAMEAAKKWPNPLARFFKGEVSEADVVGAAPVGHACEANVYVGLWHVAHNERAQAEPVLRSAEAACKQDEEYGRIVHAELAKMNGETAK